MNGISNIIWGKNLTPAEKEQAFQEYWPKKLDIMVAGRWDPSWPNYTIGLENHLRDDPEYKALTPEGQQEVQQMIQAMDAKQKVMI